MTQVARKRSQARGVTFNLLVNLTLREIRSEYKRTTLGRLWSLINPVAQIAVFSLVFGLLFQIQAQPGTNSGVHFFPLWIGIGVVTWGFISSSVNGGMRMLIGSAGLLKKVYFPRWVLVLSKILSNAFTYVIEIGVITILMAFVGGPRVLLYAPLMIPLILLVVVFTVGLALVLSVAIVYFRDVEHLWGILTQMWMYATGVMFPLSYVAGAEQRIFDDGFRIFDERFPLLFLFRLNPTERMLESVRNILYDFTVPPLENWLFIAAWAFVMLGIGILVFRRYSKNLVEEL
ncbi:ABC transporter permease [Humidisolicoccus flavus]|uniref:ABC transporter permease n=1 Tax=Humidisolicoccus flavus TaxID=3111414 RepID=UPI0032501A18